MPRISNLKKFIIPLMRQSIPWDDFWNAVLGTDSDTAEDTFQQGFFNNLLQRQGAPLTIQLGARLMPYKSAPISDVNGTVYPILLDCGPANIKTTNCSISPEYPTTTWNRQMQLPSVAYGVTYKPVYVLVDVGKTIDDCSLSLQDNFHGFNAPAVAAWFYSWDRAQSSGELSSLYHSARTSPYQAVSSMVSHTVSGKLVYEFLDTTSNRVSNGTTNVVRRAAVYLDVIDEGLDNRIVYCDTVLKLSTNDMILDGTSYNPIIGYDKNYITLTREPAFRRVFTNDYSSDSPAYQSKANCQIQALFPEDNVTYKDVVLNIGSSFGWNDVLRTKYWVGQDAGQLLSKLAITTSDSTALAFIKRLLKAVTPARCEEGQSVVWHEFSDTVYITDSSRLLGMSWIAIDANDPSGMVIQGEGPDQLVFVIRPNQF